jgi:hypothetical protein
MFAAACCCCCFSIKAAGLAAAAAYCPACGKKNMPTGKAVACGAGAGGACAMADGSRSFCRRNRQWIYLEISILHLFSGTAFVQTVSKSRSVTAINVLFSSFQSKHSTVPSRSKVTNVKRSCCQAFVVNLFEHRQTRFL